jgi:catechol 2,3-dioxygenase-like lactoylglutathione lyase family enzyme
MKIVTLVRVGSLERSLSFYSLFGLKEAARRRTGRWVELELGDAVVALHEVPVVPPDADPARVSLTFESDVPLEVLTARLSSNGYPPEVPAFDEAFGRTMMVRDPDGLLIAINERDRELYT